MCESLLSWRHWCFSPSNFNGSILLFVRVAKSNIYFVSVLFKPKKGEPKFSFSISTAPQSFSHYISIHPRYPRRPPSATSYSSQVPGSGGFIPDRPPWIPPDPSLSLVFLNLQQCLLAAAESSGAAILYIDPDSQPLGPLVSPHAKVGFIIHPSRRRAPAAVPK